VKEIKKAVSRERVVQNMTHFSYDYSIEVRYSHDTDGKGKPVAQIDFINVNHLMSFFFIFILPSDKLKPQTRLTVKCDAKRNTS
jgi:hypothetical protein